MPRAVIASQSEAAPAVVEAAVDAAVDATVHAAADAATGSAGRKARRRDIALAGTAEFDRCLARPPLVRHGSFALHLFWQSLLADDADAAARAGWNDAGWRLGLVIPKRYEASAVARNTIKRRWRDAFRRERAAWAAEFGPADLVVRMQSPLTKKTDPPLPAHVRARDRFEPQDALTALVTRLRSRRGSSSAASGSRVGSAAR